MNFCLNSNNSVLSSAWTPRLWALWTVSGVIFIHNWIFLLFSYFNRFHIVKSLIRKLIIKTKVILLQLYRDWQNLVAEQIPNATVDQVVRPATEHLRISQKGIIGKFALFNIYRLGTNCYITSKTSLKLYRARSICSEYKRFPFVLAAFVQFNRVARFRPVHILCKMRRYKITAFNQLQSPSIQC